MDKRVIINCVIIILIWICNRMAYYYLSGNTSLIVSSIILIKVDASVRLDSIKEVSLALYQNNEVDALLARIERIYQEVDEETQDYLMRLHSEFTKDMETLINNIQKRKRLINQVSQILNQIEESQNVDSLDIFSQEEDEEGEYLA